MHQLMSVTLQMLTSSSKDKRENFVTLFSTCDCCVTELLEGEAGLSKTKKAITFIDSSRLNARGHDTGLVLNAQSLLLLPAKSDFSQGQDARLLRDFMETPFPRSSSGNARMPLNKKPYESVAFSQGPSAWACILCGTYGM